MSSCKLITMRCSKQEKKFPLFSMSCPIRPTACPWSITHMFSFLLQTVIAIGPCVQAQSLDTPPASPEGCTRVHGCIFPCRTPSSSCSCLAFLSQYFCLCPRGTSKCRGQQGNGIIESWWESCKVIWHLCVLQRREKLKTAGVNRSSVASSPPWTTTFILYQGDDTHLDQWGFKQNS